MEIRNPEVRDLRESQFLNEDGPEVASCEYLALILDELITLRKEREAAQKRRESPAAAAKYRDEIRDLLYDEEADSIVWRKPRPSIWSEIFGRWR